MLYNKKTKKIKTNIDCLTCEYFDKKEKKCTGLGKNCFEYDKNVGVVIDPRTHLATKL